MNYLLSKKQSILAVQSRLLSTNTIKDISIYTKEEILEFLPDTPYLLIEQTKISFYNLLKRFRIDIRLSFHTNNYNIEDLFSWAAFCDKVRQQKPFCISNYNKSHDLNSCNIEGFFFIPEDNSEAENV